MKTLSEKIYCKDYKRTERFSYIPLKDVKEFIKEIKKIIKEEISYLDHNDKIGELINKLAGKELLK